MLTPSYLLFYVVYMCQKSQFCRFSGGVV